MVAAAKQQAITWANVDPDLCHHMASQGHSELMHNWCNSGALAMEWHLFFASSHQDDLYGLSNEAHELIEAKWRIHSSPNWAIIGSDKG